MNKHFLLFQKPQIPVVTPPPALELTGSLRNHIAGQTYSDYLTIVNSIGSCTVRLVSGTLPNGARIYVDNTLKRVYVKWGTSNSGIAIQDVPDGDLEDDGKGWQFGVGLSVSNNLSNTGSKSILFRNHSGISEAISPSVNFGSTGNVTGSCQIAQGASAKNSLTGRVFLEAIFPANVKTRYYGNTINSSSDEWQESSVSALISGDALALAIGVEFDRKRENKAAYADSFVWDYSYLPGSALVTDYPITIEVKDSTNQTAQWTGTIAEGLPNGTFAEYLPIAVSQSSVFSGTTAATLATIRDTNISPATGAVTFNTTTEWVSVDLGSAKQLCCMQLGMGIINGVTIGNLLGHNYLIQHSADGVTGWTSVSDTHLRNSFTETPPTDYDIYFSPVTARYWRISANVAIRIATLRCWGYVGGIVNATATITQSTVFGSLVGSFANLGEVPNITTTGAATGNGTLEWFKADLGSVKEVRVVVVSGGTLTGWGGAANYLNSGLAYIQTSVDNITWDTARTITGVIFDTAPMEHAFNVNAAARYVRISRPGYLSTTAFRVYTLP